MSDNEEDESSPADRSPSSRTPPVADSSERDGDSTSYRPAGLNGKWVAVQDFVKEGAVTAPAEFTEAGELVGDPTMHPEVKLGETKPPPPPMYREEGSLHSGMLYFKASASLALFSFANRWKESYVNIDPKLGILFCKNLSAFNSNRFDRVLPFSDIKSVSIARPAADPAPGTLQSCIFNVYIHANSPSVRDFGKHVAMRAQSEVEAEVWVADLQSKLLLTARVYTVGLNGEFPEHVRGVRPGVALCFSGGGGRAHVCAAGQLRALHHLGMLDKKRIDYLSGVSAGAWATSIYTFYEEGAKTDSELLGQLVSEDLGKLSMRALEKPLAPIFAPAEQDMWKCATDLVFRTNPHELWESAMTKIFLKPFGLSHKFPFARREDVAQIKLDNPHLTHTRFHVTRSTSRPFWVAHGTIVGPQWARVHDMLPIQFTPIYTGSPYLHKMHYHEASHRTSMHGPATEHRRDLWVGGGMVDSFAFGGEEPEAMGATGARPRFLPDKPRHANSFLQSLPRHLDAAMPAPLTEQSRAFGAAVREVALRSKNKHAPAGASASESSGDKDIKAMEEAMVSMRLGPHMIQRVFKYAQDKMNELNNEFAEAAANNNTGGGGGGGGSSSEGVIERKVLLPQSSVYFSLRHALAISSDAPSVNMHNRQVFKRLNVQQRYWTPVAVHGHQAGDANAMAMTHATTMDMGDGGTLDNTGLLGMLQRGVRRCIVFLNTVNQIPVPGMYFRRGSRVSLRRTSGSVQSPNTPQRDGSTAGASGGAPASPVARKGSSSAGFESSFQKSGSTSTFPGEDPPTYAEWPDEDVLPLFGQTVDEEALNYLGTHHANNKVFNIYELRPLLSALQDLFKEGKPLCHQTSHTVVENSFWGIEGGWTVDILWCYLEDSAQFRGQLPKDVRKELARGDRGEFYRFPNYLTFGQQSGKIQVEIALSRRQINLLAAYTEWAVMVNKEKIEKFISDVPAVVRKRKLSKTLNALLKHEA